MSHPLSRTTIALMLTLGCVAQAADDVPVGEPVAHVAAGAAAPRRPATEAQQPAKSGEKTLSGMSILGNQEAPKSLVLVPWKSSRIGDTLGLTDDLDDSRQPVDRDVFMRELAYYEIRSQ